MSRKKKRVYVAVPLTHRRDIEKAQQICKFLTNKGVEVISPWVAAVDAKQGLNAREVYERDVAAVVASDAVVAEVSKPSLGIGMELMVAVNAGVPIVCLHEDENDVSWMVLGAPGVHPVPYPPGCIEEGLRSMSVWLLSLHLRSIPKTLILPTKRRKLNVSKPQEEISPQGNNQER